MGIIYTIWLYYSKYHRDCNILFIHSKLLTKKFTFDRR